MILRSESLCFAQSLYLCVSHDSLEKAIVSLNGVNVWYPLGNTFFYGEVWSENPRILYVKLSVSKGYKYFDLLYLMI
jgi:hypothetical protein